MFVCFSTRFTPFTSCLLWSLHLFLSSLFSLKTLSPQTWIITISSGYKALALLVFLLFELIRNCKILRVVVQLQPHQFDFPLKTQVANYLLITRLRIYYLLLRVLEKSPRVMPVCPRYAALKLGTRVCALHCHQLVFLEAH